MAVKKDRAIEKLLIVGGKFAISMVAEGRDKKVMKALTRPFGPGEDRLAGEQPGGQRARDEPCGLYAPIGLKDMKGWGIG